MREQASISIMFLRAPDRRITFPFSKKNVDEIIANSTKTDKYSIKYTVKFGSEDSTRCYGIILQETSSPMICFSGHGTSCMSGSTGR